METLHLEAVGAVGHVLHHLLCLPVAPPAFHDFLVPVDAEIVESGHPSSYAVEMTVHKQVGHILTFGNDRVAGFFVQLGKPGHDFLNAGVVVGVGLDAIFNVIVEDVVAQLIDGF